MIARWQAWWIGCLLVAMGFIWIASGTGAQTQPIVSWDTHDQLMEWVAFPNGLEAGRAVPVERKVEGSREYVRLLLGRSHQAVFFAWPGGNWKTTRFHLAELKRLPALTRPTTHNAIRIVLRHGKTGLTDFSGMWAHRSYEYDDMPVDLPMSDAHASPDDGTWQEVVVRFAESPLLKEDEDIVHVHFGLAASEWRSFRSVEEGMAVWGSLPDDSYLDIDRVQLLKLEETLPAPTIAAFHPKRGRWGTEVTIEGSGFAVPARRNRVLFGQDEIEIISGDSSHIVVTVVGGGTFALTVAVPGGRRATTTERFVTIGDTGHFTVEGGDGQKAQVGSALQPFRVKARDAEGEPVPGESVSFRVVSGSGTLSVTETMTDDNGLAATVLTLGATPGTVRVEAAIEGFRPRVFTATATP